MPFSGRPASLRHWRISSSLGAVEHRADGLEPELGGGPAQVGLEDLAHVHAARHAQRVQQDLDRGAVGQERHVLLGEDLGDDALVAVAAGHLVADRDDPLGGDVDLDHLLHARGQLVAALQGVELAVLLVEEGLDPRGVLADDLAGLLGLLGAADVEGLELEPLALVGQRLAGPCRGRAACRWSGRCTGPSTTSSSALIICLNSSAILTFSAASMSFSSFSKALRSSSFRLIRRLNRWVSMTMPSTPDGTSSESFFTSSPARPKIACSSFSSGVSSLLRLRRHLADEDVARLDEGADPDDAVLVEVPQGLLARRSGCRG